MITSIPRIRLETETFQNGELELVRLSGRETISQPFAYEILAVCTDPSAVEPEELVGQEATLVITRDDDEARRIHGMIAKVSDRLETETDHSTYQLTLVPRAHRLSLVETLDVFLDISVPDVIRQKMHDAGFVEKPADAGPDDGAPGRRPGEITRGHDFELRLYESYPVRDFIVQYRETDLAFVSRLCEHLGISYFFEHTNGRDVMVFTDVNEGFRPIAGGGTAMFRRRGEHADVFAFEETIRMIPAQYVVRDYNYRTPQVTLTGEVSVPTGVGSVVEYGTHVKTPEEAAQMAHIRAQERMAGRRVYEGKSDVPALRSGARFTLEGHPRGDTKLLVTEVTVSAEQVTAGFASIAASFFRADFKAISDKRRYRPARITPKPRIHGVVNGVIDSANEASQYADVDSEGRYRVRFLFDTTGPDKGQASKLVRMAQPHAGPGYGMHFPLRPGVEVIITFIDGDPDRPIIAATVPNPQQGSPVQAGNAPRNIIRTGAGNEINFDDTKDSTRIKMTVPFKSTTFQLGARNGEEEGALLQTEGNASTLAVGVVTSISAINTTVSSLAKFAWSSNIYTVAAPPGALEAFSTVAEVSSVALDMASTAVEVALAVRAQWVVDARNAYRAKTKVLAASAPDRSTAIGASEAALGIACDAALLSAYDALPKLPGTSSIDRESPEFKAWRATAAGKGADLVALDRARAVRAYKARFTEKFGTAKPSEYEIVTSFATPEDKQARALIALGDKLAAYKAAMAAYNETVAEVVAPDSEGDQLLGEPDTRVAAMKLALAELEAAAKDVNMPPAALADATDGVGTHIDAWTAVAAAEKKTYDDEVEDLENGETAKRLKRDAERIEYAKTFGASALMLMSELWTAYASAKDVIHDYRAMKGAQKDFWKAVEASNARAKSSLSPMQESFDPWTYIKKVKHTVGSEWNTEVFGNAHLLLRGDEMVKILSAGSTDEVTQAVTGGEVRVVASKLVGLHTVGDIEVAGSKLVNITSVNADSDAKLSVLADTIDLRAGTNLQGAKAPTNLIAITSDEGEIKLQSKKALDLCSMEGDVAVTSAEGNLTLKAAKAAKLLAGSWGLTIDDGAHTASLGNARFELRVDVKKKTARLGAAGEASQLQIDPDKVLLQTKGTLSFKAETIVLDAKTLQGIKGEKLDLGNLLVKNDMNTTVALMQARIATLETTAEGAEQAADRAAKAADRAEFDARIAGQRIDVAMRKADRAQATADNAARLASDIKG